MQLFERVMVEINRLAESIDDDTRDVVLARISTLKAVIRAELDRQQGGLEVTWPTSDE